MLEHLSMYIKGEWTSKSDAGLYPRLFGVKAVLKVPKRPLEEPI